MANKMHLLCNTYWKFPPPSSLQLPVVVVSFFFAATFLQSNHCCVTHARNFQGIVGITIMTFFLACIYMSSRLSLFWSCCLCRRRKKTPIKPNEMRLYCSTTYVKN